MAGQFDAKTQESVKKPSRTANIIIEFVLSRLDDNDENGVELMKQHFLDADSDVSSNNIQKYLAEFMKEERDNTDYQNRMRGTVTSILGPELKENRLAAFEAMFIMAENTIMEEKHLQDGWKMVHWLVFMINEVIEWTYNEGPLGDMHEYLHLTKEYLRDNPAIDNWINEHNTWDRMPRLAKIIPSDPAIDLVQVTNQPEGDGSVAAILTEIIDIDTPFVWRTVDQLSIGLQPSENDENSPIQHDYLPSVSNFESQSGIAATTNLTGGATLVQPSLMIDFPEIFRLREDQESLLSPSLLSEAQNPPETSTVDHPNYLVIPNVPYTVGSSGQGSSDAQGTSRTGPYAGQLSGGRRAGRNRSRSRERSGSRERSSRVRRDGEGESYSQDGRSGNRRGQDAATFNNTWDILDHNYSAEMPYGRSENRRGQDVVTFTNPLDILDHDYSAEMPDSRSENRRGQDVVTFTNPWDIIDHDDSAEMPSINISVPSDQEGGHGNQDEGNTPNREDGMGNERQDEVYAIQNSFASLDDTEVIEGENLPESDQISRIRIQQQQSGFWYRGETPTRLYAPTLNVDLHAPEYSPPYQTVPMYSKPPSYEKAIKKTTIATA